MMKKMMKTLSAILVAVTCSMTTAISVFAKESPSLSVEVTLEGTLPDPSEDYVFVMEATDASYPMPEGYEDGYTFTITGAGKANLPVINFDKVGIYTYTLKQVKGSNSKCTYDETEYTLTYSVTNTNPDDPTDGDLTVTVNANGKKESSITFHNVYEVEPTPTPTTTPKPSSKPGSPVTPTPTAKTTSMTGWVNTGDTSNMMLYVGLIGVACAAIGILVFARKKYSED